MKFKEQHLNKWVAIQDEKVIAMDTTLKGLHKKVAHLDDVRFTFVPKGPLAISSWRI